MNHNLSEQQIARFKEKFKLSYRLPYLEHYAHKIPLEGLDVLEIGGALPASLVLDHCR